VNLEKVLGKKRAVIPETDADQATVDAYYRNVGWPETPDKYGQPALPPGITADEATDKRMREICHKLRLTDAQFRGLAQEIAAWNLAEERNRQADAAKAAETATAAEKTAWGSRYDYNNQLVVSVAAAFLPPERLKSLQDKGLLADPDLRALLAQVGDAVAPDRLHVNTGGRADTAGLQRQIDELQTSEAYRKSDHPRHNAVTAQVQQLYQQLVNAKK
jgi:hypothetical protein